MTTTDPDIHPLRWLTLVHTPGLGPAGANRLLKACGGIEELWAADRQQLLETGVRPSVVEDLLKRSGLNSARRELAGARKEKLHILTQDDPLFPPLLREINDPPLLLYGRGELETLTRPNLALVGARAASSYGLKMAERLGAELAAAGITVVSGGAMGIDGAAHRGALSARDGKTVAVLGCGLDQLYPPQNKKLFAMIAATGMLLGEYPPGIRPEPFRFPARNRIISGMSVGAVVIEAARRSGSLITAEMAMEQGREVFAVPGRADSGKSEGCHRLIQEGARLVQRAEDILSELRLNPLIAMGAASEPAASMEHKGEGEHAAQDRESAALLAALDEYPRAIEEIIAACGLPAWKVNALLLELEIAGRVEMESGPKYKKS